MRNKIIALALGVLLTMPCVLRAEEIEIQLMEVIPMGVIPGDDPLDGPARKNSTNSLIEEQKPTAIKFIRNGQLFILHKNKLYNAEGALIR